MGKHKNKGKGKHGRGFTPRFMKGSGRADDMKKHGTKAVETVVAGGHTVHITPQAWRKMLNYTEISTGEVGWLGWVERDPNNPFQLTISDVVLPKQQAHGTTTEIQPEHMHALYEEWETAHGTEYAFNHMESINLWGHSHVNMTPSPSGQDDTTFNTFKAGGKPMFLRLIMNKSQEVHVDVADMQYNTLTKCADVYLKDPGNPAITITMDENKAVEDIIAYGITGSSGWVMNNIGEEIVLINMNQGVVLRGLQFTTAQKYDDTLKEDIRKALKDRVLPFVSAVTTTHNSYWSKSGTTTMIGAPSTGVGSCGGSTGNGIMDWKRLSAYQLWRFASIILIATPHTRKYIMELREKHKPWVQGNTLPGGAYKGLKAFARKKCGILHNIFIECRIGLPTERQATAKVLELGAHPLNIYTLLQSIMTATPATFDEMDMLSQMHKGLVSGKAAPDMYDDFFNTFWNVVDAEAALEVPSADVEYVMRDLFMDHYGTMRYRAEDVAQRLTNMAQRYYLGTPCGEDEKTMFPLIEKMELQNVVDPTVLTEEELLKELAEDEARITGLMEMTDDELEQYQRMLSGGKH